MTATLTPVDVRPAPAGPAPRSSRLWTVGGTLAILGALLLGFVAEVGPLGDLCQERDRRVGYADLRASLAEATAPIGPPTEPGTPVALLKIPQLGVKEVIREGSSAEALASGPGHRRDTVLPGQAGNSIVTGRRTGSSRSTPS